MYVAWVAVVAASAGFPLVEAGQPRAAIVPVDKQAPPEIRRAVAELQRVLLYRGFSAHSRYQAPTSPIR
jgi:hypothetical protein